MQALILRVLAWAIQVDLSTRAEPAAEPAQTEHTDGTVNATGASDAEARQRRPQSEPNKDVEDGLKKLEGMVEADAGTFKQETIDRRSGSLLERGNWSMQTSLLQMQNLDDLMQLQREAEAAHSDAVRRTVHRNDPKIVEVDRHLGQMLLDLDAGRAPRKHHDPAIAKVNELLQHAHSELNSMPSSFLESEALEHDSSVRVKDTNALAETDADLTSLSKQVEDEFQELAKGLQPKVRVSSFVQEKDGLLKDLNPPKDTFAGVKEKLQQLEDKMEADAQRIKAQGSQMLAGAQAASFVEVDHPSKVSSLLKSLDGQCALHHCQKGIKDCVGNHDACEQRLKCVESDFEHAQDCYTGLSWDDLHPHEIELYDCAAKQQCFGKADSQLETAALSFLQMRAEDQASLAHITGFAGINAKLQALEKQLHDSREAAETQMNHEKQRLDAIQGEDEELEEQQQAKNKEDYTALKSSLSASPSSFVESGGVLADAHATLDALEATIKTESARLDAKAHPSSFAELENLSLDEMTAAQLEELQALPTKVASLLKGGLIKRCVAESCARPLRSCVMGGGECAERVRCIKQTPDAGTCFGSESWHELHPLEIKLYHCVSKNGCLSGPDVPSEFQKTTAAASYALLELEARELAATDGHGFATVSAQLSRLEKDVRLHLAMVAKVGPSLLEVDHPAHEHYHSVKAKLKKLNAKMKADLAHFDAEASSFAQHRATVLKKRTAAKHEASTMGILEDAQAEQVEHNDELEKANKAGWNEMQGLINGIEASEKNYEVSLKPLAVAYSNMGHEGPPTPAQDLPDEMDALGDPSSLLEQGAKRDVDDALRLSKLHLKELHEALGASATKLRADAGDRNAVENDVQIMKAAAEIVPASFVQVHDSAGTAADASWREKEQEMEDEAKQATERIANRAKYLGGGSEAFGVNAYDGSIDDKPVSTFDQLLAGASSYLETGAKVIAESANQLRTHTAR